MNWNFHDKKFCPAFVPWIIHLEIFFIEGGRGRKRGFELLDNKKNANWSTMEYHNIVVVAKLKVNFHQQVFLNNQIHVSWFFLFFGGAFFPFNDEIFTRLVWGSRKIGSSESISIVWRKTSPKKNPNERHWKWAFNTRNASVCFPSSANERKSSHIDYYHSFWDSPTGWSNENGTEMIVSSFGKLENRKQH